MAEFDYPDRVDAHGRRTIVGALRGGLTLSDAANVQIQGAVAGPVRIGRDAVLSVLGSFVGDVIANEGTLIVSGQAVLDASAFQGQLAVAIESVITIDDNSFILEADGSLRPVIGNVEGPLNVHADRVCYWDPDARRFRALGSASSSR